jgi:hypothetical protein
VTVAVLKSDEGIIYYVDLRAVSDIPTLERGATLTLVGFEGPHPEQLAAQVIYSPDLTPATDAPSVRSERIRGRIESLAGDMVVLVRATYGNEVTILLRGVSTTTRGLLQLGDDVTVFGRPGDADFVVTGIIQSQD